MLDFWYSEHCTRQMKMFISIIICLMIHYCSTIEKLAPLYVGLSLAIGICIHLIYMYQKHLVSGHTYKKILQYLNYLLPIIGLILLSFFFPAENKLFLNLQSFGFILLGLFIVTVYQNRAKRSE